MKKMVHVLQQLIVWYGRQEEGELPSCLPFGASGKRNIRVGMTGAK